MDLRLRDQLNFATTRFLDKRLTLIAKGRKAMSVAKEMLVYLIARYRRHSMMRSLDRVAVAFHKGHQNLSFNHRLNGERMVLRKLRNVGLSTIFDVGANEGDWAHGALAAFPAARIHCFELAAAPFAKLARRFHNKARVATNLVALGDKVGTVKFLFADGHDAHSTLLEETFSDGEYSPAEAQMVTGDKYLEAHQISHIDYLKIDTVGSENLVLAGFQAALQNGKIKCIQFEYGAVNKISHFYLMDFYRLLEPLGYTIGKIFPHYVDFCPYHLDMDNFLGANYLAVHKSQTEIIERLQGPSKA